jgi:plasmid maintenance system antidote protein VapI
MSVTAAAEILGVGRPALSNFLNGNSDATPEMAARLERAFGLPAKELLDLQAIFDASQNKAKGGPVSAKIYVPPFLTIKSSEIEAWAGANQTKPRERLAVFLRTLVHSTGADLRTVDFPGNDDAQRKGWDGIVDAARGTPWIPEGPSGWEFGVDVKIKTKADGDFAKSVEAVDKAERDEMTFVFVTPRRWTGKTDWVKDNRAKRLWKDVRAYDASDLEQWLEQSIPGQAWFVNETNRPEQAVRALDKAWTDWANAARPPLDPALMTPAVKAACQTMETRLANAPNGPTIVAADSIDEALAFLAQLFSEAGGDKLRDQRDRVVIFDRPGFLPKLAEGVKDFIAIAATRDVERELAPLAHTIHTIVVYPRNAANADPHIVLEPLNYDSFRIGLDAMGMSRDQITRYDAESGRSLTVLRRRLASAPIVRTPEWAADHTTASSLIPFLFVGAWNSAKAVDQSVLQLLANSNSYEPLEKECQRLAKLNDAPLWSVGTHRGVISKIDLLFAISGAVTASDLQRFFDMAKLVLGEDDPKLDLPDGEQWAAALHGKTREFSGVLRQGFAETLVLLAVHGAHLFGANLGFDCEGQATRLVRALLTPLKTRVLEANDRDLPHYAEAAPLAFLSLIEDDLLNETPAVYGLLRPASADVFTGGCSRTGLLWALETLAWNPNYLPRVALILAQLAEIEIKDNWLNKPINSLQSIFSAWMPQTAATQDERLAVMKLIAEKRPNIGWTLIIDQLNTGPRTGHHNHKPSWRTDGHGFGEPFRTWTPVIAFLREMADIALAWNGHTATQICDLIGHVHDLGRLGPEYQAQVWELVTTWAGTATDLDKATAREKIRVTTMSPRGKRRAQRRGFAQLSKEGGAAYAALQPSDLLNKHGWLFKETWVDASADEIEEENVDHDQRQERITRLRLEALREIISKRGAQGAIELAENGNAGWTIGWLLACDILSEGELLDLMLDALPAADKDEAWARKSLIRGALHSIQDKDKRTHLLAGARARLDDEAFVRLVLLAPFRRESWTLIDALGDAQRAHYWRHVPSDWIRDAPEESNEAVERLLAAKRPRAAFASIHYELEQIDTQLIYRLMSEMLGEGDDLPGQYQLDRYYIDKAFARIDADPLLSLDQKASLEFAYLDALSRPWGREGYGIPNLERYVELHPELFVQALVWTFKRNDDGQDPDEWRVARDEARGRGERGYALLEALERIPGHDALGVLKPDLLGKWIDTVRSAAKELARLEVADSRIGHLLSNADNGKDGVWPCEPVRQVMEDVHSKEMMSGAHTGLYNARGVTWRGEGGAQERALADKYRAWANALQYSHPFVASELLMGMVKTYEHEADAEDTEAGIRRRLR